MCPGVCSSCIALNCGLHCKPKLLSQEPVSTTEVPDYRDVIKQPMDFGTISAKLTRGQYQHPREMQADVDLIWDNCIKARLEPGGWEGAEV